MTQGGRLAAGMVVVWLTGACSLDSLLKSDALPPNVTDPAITETPAGALTAYYGTILGLQNALASSESAEGSSFVIVSGLLSDELIGSSTGLGSNPVDLRTLAESPNTILSLSIVFRNLNNVRQRSRQARGLVRDYLPDEPALQAHLYAIEGYAEVMLAELFCSGIPLSTVDYQGDYTLRPGLPTAEVFTHAIALFDTAAALAGDSVLLLNLSRMGRARALVGAGDYVAAAAAVMAVPDTFRYLVRYGAGYGIGYYAAVNQPGIWRELSVADGEGGNGLPYRTSGDPRSRATQLPLTSGRSFYHPDKYQTDGADTVVLASGVEARLITAEAQWQAGDAAWLTTLNALRTDGAYDTTASSPPDTLWHAGTGGVAGLAPLADPGSDTARVSLLFRERAFWLFLTGHRQGDMRRLVRQYHRLQSQVYPVGAGAFGGIYGSYIDAPVPWEERTLNPLFTGCLSRD